MSILLDFPCVDCGCDLVSAMKWPSLPESYRTALVAQGARRHMGRRLCSRCCDRRRVAGTLIDAERLTLAHVELVDEWEHFTKDRPTYRQNVKAFAAYLGRNWKSVEKALTRSGIGPDRMYGEAS